MHHHSFRWRNKQKPRPQNLREILSSSCPFRNEHPKLGAWQRWEKAFPFPFPPFQLLLFWSWANSFLTFGPSGPGLPGNPFRPDRPWNTWKNNEHQKLAAALGHSSVLVNAYSAAYKHPVNPGRWRCSSPRQRRRKALSLTGLFSCFPSTCWKTL